MNKKQIKKIVLDTLIRYRHLGNELQLPVPIKSIAKSFPNIRVIPYSRFMRDQHYSLKQMCEYAGSNDASTDFNAKLGLYLIYYNDIDSNIKASYRYRWNIAHELGHVLLNHHSNIKTRLFRNSLNPREYKILEKEADWFASYILVPHAILQELNTKLDSSLIHMYCNISIEAANYRQKDFEKWKRNKFNDMYDKEILKVFSFCKVCEHCKVTLSNHYNYCPICGSDRYIKKYYTNPNRKFGDIMKYTKLDNKNGTLIRCPICNNEEIVEGAEFCHICGSPVVNRCIYDVIDQDEIVQCSQAQQSPIPVNARYCPYCDSITTFFSKGVLKAWNDISLDDEFPL